MKQKCPTCGKNIDRSSINYAYPFCCERCRLIDLGKWFDEKNSIPAVEPENTESVQANNIHIVKH